MIMDIQTLDSFNAKYLDHEHFIKTFVPSLSFNVIAKNGPVLVVGARGSGKTTLLKMLGNENLPFWKHDRSEEYKNNIKLEGIYVPADSVWADRIRALNYSGISNQVSELFAASVFSTNVYLCSIEALTRSLNLDIQKSPNIGSKISKQLESAIKMIADYLQLDIERNSFLSIKHALRSRMKFLGEYAKRKAIHGELSITDLENDISFIYLDLDSTLESILDAYDEVFDRPGIRWAVLLDEFEVAPESLQKEIINKLRSSSKKHIYKIALVPCGKHLEGKSSVSSKNDYDVLQLWSRGFEQNKQFCKDILESRFNITNAESVFGNSDFVEATKISSEILEKSFTELYSKDQGFKDYIDKKGLEINDIYNDSPRGNNLRKIGPEVIFRNCFKSSKGNTKRRDSLPGFYSGWHAIVKISEGNPRWIMATITSLFEHTQGKEKKNISKSIQVKQITNTTNAFRSMIGTTALQDNMGITTNTPPIHLIDELSKFIKHESVDGKFKSDPYGHFIIDDKVSDDMISALRIAFNHGAIVSLDEDEHVDIWSYRSLEGHRFRLSYLLSPVYQLPLRSGKKINLSSALSKISTDKYYISGQRDLF